MIRILDGSQQIACHRRSYDRHQVVLDPEHQQILLKQKRKAFNSTPTGRLAQACCQRAETLLDKAFADGESAGSQTSQLIKLRGSLWRSGARSRHPRGARKRHCASILCCLSCCVNASGNSAPRHP